MGRWLLVKVKSLCIVDLISRHGGLSLDHLPSHWWLIQTTTAGAVAVGITRWGGCVGRRREDPLQRREPHSYAHADIVCTYLGGEERAHRGKTTKRVCVQERGAPEQTLKWRKTEVEGGEGKHQRKKLMRWTHGCSLQLWDSRELGWGLPWVVSSCAVCGRVRRASLHAGPSVCPEPRQAQAFLFPRLGMACLGILRILNPSSVYALPDQSSGNRILFTNQRL